MVQKWKCYYNVNISYHALYQFIFIFQLKNMFYILYGAYLCSMMGAIVCGVGYSTVMWGQAREDGEMHKNSGNPLSSPDDKVPLLQEYSQV